MKLGIFFLALGYILSQFFRSFLAVLTPVLSSDIGTTAADLSLASGVWFMVFAAMQVPVGWALDHVGPRLTASVLLLVGGGGGSLLFGLANDPLDIQIAMAFIGVGCSPILMAAYYFFGRIYPSAAFATLAGTMIGVGSLGNLAGSAPLAYAAEVVGWRETIWGLGAITALIAITLMLVLRDPPPETGGEKPKGGFIDILRIRALWFILPLALINYAPVAGLRGLWSGPYLEDVFGMDKAGIGNVTFWMALAMALGSFLFGPAERLIGSKKRVVLFGNLGVAVCCLVLWMKPDSSAMMSGALFAAIGLLGVSFPVIIAHGRQFFPTHLTGRGMTLLNLFSIGGAGLMQFATGALSASMTTSGASPVEIYSAIFLTFAIVSLVGSAFYALGDEK